MTTWQAVAVGVVGTLGTAVGVGLIVRWLFSDVTS